MNKHKSHDDIDKLTEDARALMSTSSEAAGEGGKLWRQPSKEARKCMAVFKRRLLIARKRQIRPCAIILIKPWESRLGSAHWQAISWSNAEHQRAAPNGNC